MADTTLAQRGNRPSGSRPAAAAALDAAGYDRDIALLGGGPLRTFLAAPVPAWRRVRLDRDTLTVPAGARLDLGATAKAWAADHGAAAAARTCGTGVLVALGGDIATAGPAPGRLGRAGPGPAFGATRHPELST